MTKSNSLQNSAVPCSVFDIQVLDRMIEAPQGIKRLRELILQLAVQGKLVQQRPEEGTAAEELVKIKQAKELIPTFSIRRTSKVKDDAEHEFLYIPETWSSCRFDEIAAIQGGIAKGRKLRDQETVELPYLRVANVQRGFLNLTQLKTISIPVQELEKYRLAEKDLLITEGGDWDKVGRTAVWKCEVPTCLHQNHVFRARLPFNVIEINWVVMFLNSTAGRIYFAGASKQTTNLASINMTQLRACPIPLPPLAEQKRIVAKVDELMAWCDQLEALKEKRDALQKAALKSCVNHLTSRPESLVGPASCIQEPVSPQDHTPSRIREGRPTIRLLANLSDLIRTPSDVKQLRDAILQLAVQGRLVEQKETDGTAADLLKQIEAAKAADLQRRKANGERIRKEKVLPPIEKNEIPFDIPENWEWVRLGEYGDWGAGATPNRKNPAYYNGTCSWFKSGELNDKTALADSEEKVTDLALSECSLRKNKLGDVLIAMYGATIGKLAILAEESTTNQAVCACTSNEGIYNRFLFKLLMAWRVRFTEQGAGGAQPNISRIKIINTVVPLPPLAEQQRIVKKVDELMEWCDELESLLQTQTATAARFAAAIAQQGAA